MVPTECLAPLYLGSNEGTTSRFAEELQFITLGIIRELF